jgi:hypothetical protein
VAGRAEQGAELRLVEIVDAINDAWTHGRFDELRAYFHPEVVLAQPGLARRVIGVDALIDSYRRFAAEAAGSFRAGETRVDEAGDSAVTTTPWTTDDERGWDLLVFGKREGRWVVVWRTVVVER